MTESHETRKRSFVKAVSYRCLSVIVDTAVAYFITRKLGISIAVVVAVNTYSTFLYYGHERIWGHVRFGLRKDAPPTQS